MWCNSKRHEAKLAILSSNKHPHPQAISLHSVEGMIKLSQPTGSLAFSQPWGGGGVYISKELCQALKNLLHPLQTSHHLLFFSPKLSRTCLYHFQAIVSLELATWKRGGGGERSGYSAVLFCRFTTHMWLYSGSSNRNLRAVNSNADTKSFKSKWQRKPLPRMGLPSMLFPRHLMCGL